MNAHRSVGGRVGARVGDGWRRLRAAGGAVVVVGALGTVAACGGGTERPAVLVAGDPDLAPGRWEQVGPQAGILAVGAARATSASVFVSSESGYAVSTDDGLSWQSVKPPVAKSRSIATSDGGQVLVVTDPKGGGMRRSIDGGATWESLEIAAGVVTTDQRGAFWAAGAEGVWFSEDGTGPFVEMHGPFTEEEGTPFDFFALSPRIYVSLRSEGEGFALLRSNDRGQTWEILTETIAGGDAPAQAKAIRLSAAGDFSLDQGGAVLAVPGQGVFFGDPDAFWFVPVDTELPPLHEAEGYVVASDRSFSGRRFIAIENRVVVWPGWAIVDPARPLGIVTTLSLTYTEVATLWAGTEQGLYRMVDPGAAAMEPLVAGTG